MNGWMTRALGPGPQGIDAAALLPHRPLGALLAALRRDVIPGVVVRLRGRRGGHCGRERPETGDPRPETRDPSPSPPTGRAAAEEKGRASPRDQLGRRGVSPGRAPRSRRDAMGDLVAVWEVALSDGVHKIEFEHGTTSGKRVVYVDGKEAIRREWLFKLVGKETFRVGAAQTKASISIDAVSGFAYEYTLEIDGKSLKKHREDRSRTTHTWLLHLDGLDWRVVLEKDTMDVWCNGQKMETAGEFVDDGTETHFSVGSHDCYIKAVSSGKRREGIVHTLIVGERQIPEALE
uniref:Fas apoptotic inhibitory molecule 1 n=2 Tax=Ornithorhynchus anatinus TaxID=9258 RepID=A0A6I8NZA6_ORNAN